MKTITTQKDLRDYQSSLEIQIENALTFDELTSLYTSTFGREICIKGDDSFINICLSKKRNIEQIIAEKANRLNPVAWQKWFNRNEPVFISAMDKFSEELGA